MRLRHLLILVLVLSVIGTGFFVFKWQVLGFPLSADRDADTWTVEARVAFSRSTAGPVKASFGLPSEPPGFRIFDEQFISRGYGLALEGEGESRRAVWSLRRARGEQALYYRVTLFRDRTHQPERPVPGFPPVPRLEEPEASALDELVTRVRQESADIATFAAGAIRVAQGTEGAVRLFTGARPDPAAQADLVIKILHSARIPAQVIQALRLADDRRDAELEFWIMVHNGSEWLYFDPREGRRGLPANTLVWSWSGERVLEVEGARSPRVSFSMRYTIEDALRVAEFRAQRDHPRIVDFSLLNLPLQTQSLYSILLLVPLGAFLVVLLRNVVGISTFGTFMPVLVAMAFRETQLLNGIVLFVLIVAAGLSIRFYLERLRLLLVPRLAAVLTVVVLLMALVSIVTHRLGIEVGLSVALFPMVIIAMTIERMSILWEERGPAEAIKEGIGTLVAAAVIYLVMIMPAVRYFLLVFPETLLVVLAAILLLGRYTGYRLTELLRFRALAGGGK
ncbi:inactive transglutaminase family protein [Wenzhouxiangella sp. XN24]|uniref:UUP1 family membrane protein n=1 Tax=Wenzhouxiangella sp. XN24 TaxID=2713569 RepID=UPI0013EA2AFB|nr:inactive transglutaminase family protein [Wenzhouxiangella sp. XN24]